MSDFESPTVITADNITDEQIRELREFAVENDDYIQIDLCDLASSRCWESYRINGIDHEVTKAEARRRCADAINAVEREYLDSISDLARKERP